MVETVLCTIDHPVKNWLPVFQDQRKFSRHLKGLHESVVRNQERLIL
jgi:hypothetical protein